jgi:hypothetical protein
MGVNYFTDENIELLRKNKYVKHVSKKGITYTTEFKNLFIEEHNFKSPQQIFEDAGLPVHIIGQSRINNCNYAWRKKYKEGYSLEDKRKENTGRPIKRDLSPEEIIERQKLQIETLQQENEFLRQIRRLERRYQPKKSPSKKNSK